MNKANKKIEVDPRDIDLNALRELLQYGDHKTIAEMTGYNASYVRLVLNPKRNEHNLKIVIAAVNLVKDRVKIELDPQVADRLTKKKGGVVVP